MAAPTAKRGAGDLAALPEGVLLDVFSRLRIKDLLLLAATCRRWLYLFTDPAFLLPAAQGQGARLLGFFFQQTSFVRCDNMLKAHRMQNSSAFAPTFFPTPWSPLGPADRALTSFVTDDDGAFNYAEPLASRCGIVLMRLVPRASSTGLLFGICNPVTGERHVAPPMECTCLGRLHVPCGYAIITTADIDLDGSSDHQRRPTSSSRRHVFSQLLVVTRYKYTRDGRVHVHSYSASTRSWSAPAVFPVTEDLSVASARSAIVHRGAAHWLYDDNAAASRAPTNNLCILSAEVGTTSPARVSLTRLPTVTAGQTPFLCVGRDGRLSIACVHGMHVAVWTQQQQDGGDHASWLRARLIRIPIEVPSAHPYAILLRREWSEFDGGAMLVLFDGGAVFVLDLEKKVVEKLMDCPPRLFANTRCEMVVPYEMDLSEFFASQLGGLARGKSQHIIDAVKQGK